jgi:diacylglycerol kinase (ATP)
MTLGEFLMKRIKSFGYAWAGFVFGLRTQWSLRLQVIVAAVAILFSAWFRISPGEWAVVVLCCGMVLAAELFNTALEQLLDKLHPQQDKSIGWVKDLAAGAVMLCAITAAIVGLVIFLPKVLAMIG